MSDITQKLGFDVADGVAALGKLDQAIKQHTGTLNSLQGAYKNLNTGTQINQQLQSVGKQSQVAATQVEKATKRINSSFQGVSLDNKSIGTLVNRVLVTQAVVSQFANVRNSLSESTAEAVNFQQSLAEIQTISKPLRGNTDELASRVRALSDEFNTPLEDVNAGLYETISNQVEGTANQFNLLTEAQRLGRVGNASTEDSINILTATLNGFGRKMSEVDELSANWFRTVDLGRLQVSDVANSIGRLGGLATQSGVSLEEVQAALATITISGVKPAEAITQVRSAMTSFIKPSDAMKDGIRDIGFTSSEQAIGVLGLSGTIEKLIDNTDGSTQALAKYFPNVRALAGVLNIAGENAEQFGKALKVLENPDVSNLEKAFDIVTGTDAEKVTKELNKLKNFLTEEFGQSVLSAGAGLVDLTGGMDNLRAAGAGTIGSLPGLVLGIAGYAAELKGASLQTEALENNTKSLRGSLLNGVGKAAGVAGLAIAGVQAYNSFQAEQLQQAHEFRRKQDERALDQLRQSANEEVKITQDKWSRIRELTNANLASTLTGFNQTSFGIGGETDALADSVGTGIEKVFNARESILNALIQTSQSRLQESRDAAKTAEATIVNADDELFTRRTSRLDQQKQLNANLDLTRKLGREAAEALADATTPEQAADANEIFARAKSFERAAQSVAQQIGTNKALEKSDQALLELSRQRANAQREYSTTQRNQSAIASEVAREESAKVRSLKEEFAGLTEAIKLFDESGNPLSQEQRVANVAKFNEELNAFRNNAANLDQLDFGGLVDLTKIQLDLQNALSSVEVQSIQFGEGALKGLNDQLQNAISEAMSKPAMKAVTDLIRAETGEEVTDPSRVQGGTNRAEDQDVRRSEIGAELRVQEDAASRAFGRVSDGTNRLVDNLNSAFGGARIGSSYLIDGLLSTIGATDGKVGEGFLDYSAFLTQLKETANTQNTDPENLQDLQSRFDEVQSKDFFGGATNGSAEQVQRLLKTLEEGIQATTNAEQLRQELQTVQPQVPQVDPSQAIQRLELQQQPPQTNQAAAQAASQAAGALGGVTGAARSAAAALASIQAPTGGVEAAYFGKTIYRAAGGVARGVDQVNAILSKGEHVTNARSARRFSTQLQAMNAGSTPVFTRSSESSTTNVGDVHLNFSGSDPVSARSLAHDFRRELRRKTARL
ncbi:phage tail tape measure protein [Rhodopirellula halodulae]|uniref:phage tail tape measure protein n=1 Tax=Rhodopirellula halodulae TaxID=2894198 RepID=UPI001E4D7553|nr:phage tail tape measure protein [Rhodopirellula sp. JC737]MCC9655598.1 phage tail tape measure protein [Rhodopirellula sp. JC737]